MGENVGAVGAEPAAEHFAEFPDGKCNQEPNYRSDGEHDRSFPFTHRQANYEREGNQAEPSHGSSGHIDGGCSSTAFRAIIARPLFFLLLAFPDKRGRRRDDSGKCQKDTTNFGAISLRNQAGEGGDGTAKRKA